MHGSRLAEQGEALVPLPLTLGAEQPTITSPSTSIAEAATRRGSAGRPAPGNGTTRESSIQANRIKPKDWLNESPPGLPLIAANQTLHYNAEMSREYGVLSHRILLDRQNKIWSLSQALWDNDKEDEADHIERLKTLIFKPEQLLERHCRVNGPCTLSHPRYQFDAQSKAGAPERARSQQPVQSEEGRPEQHLTQDSKDRILETLFPMLKSYYEFLLLVHKIRKLHRVSQDEHKNFLTELENGNLLSGDAWGSWKEDAADFVTTRPDRIHGPFESIIYGKSKWCAQKIFLWAFRSRNQPNSDSNTYLSTNGLEALTRALGSVFCMLVLVLPIAVLFLTSLSKGQSLGVVVVFGALFVLLLSGLDVKLERMLLGYSAYIAVMATLLQSCRDL
ncbi:hypothetical protein BJ170DRAFT_76758 [Xylariales sp. AK1849]|nr:hypothetical protein BJ170DRAFT_76758 [Xylariales sp. AK1849]